MGADENCRAHNDLVRQYWRQGSKKHQAGHGSHFRDLVDAELGLAVRNDVRRRGAAIYELSLCLELIGDAPLDYQSRKIVAAQASLRGVWIDDGFGIEQEPLEFLVRGNVRRSTASANRDSDRRLRDIDDASGPDSALRQERVEHRPRPDHRVTRGAVLNNLLRRCSALDPECDFISTAALEGALQFFKLGPDVSRADNRYIGAGGGVYHRDSSDRRHCTDDVVS